MFVGRKSILERQEGLWQKSTPSLVTVRGRRRIGKSTRVAEFARRSSDYFISIEGLAPGEGIDKKVQLRSWQLRFTREGILLAPSIRTDHLLDFAIPVERMFE